MTLRFTGNRLAAAAVVGAVAFGAIGCASKDPAKIRGALSKVVQVCIPLIEEQIDCLRTTDPTVAQTICIDNPAQCSAACKYESDLNSSKCPPVAEAIRQGVINGQDQATITDSAVSAYNNAPFVLLTAKNVTIGFIGFMVTAFLCAWLTTAGRAE